MAALRYQLEIVDLPAGQQRGPNYLAVSPVGRVPYAEIDGVGLAETLAIISYLAALRPDAGILPQHDGPMALARLIGALAFVCGTLHPIVRGLASPQRVTTTDREGVREMSRRLAAQCFAEAEPRLAEHGWFLGTLSIVDVYLRWALGVAETGGFDLAPFPRLAVLGDRLTLLPAFNLMLGINQAIRAGRI